MTARQQRWPTAAVVLVVVLAGLMLGALLSPLFFGHPVGPLVVIGILVLVGVGVAGCLVLARHGRRQGWKVFERSVLHDIGDRDRNAVRDAIRHGEPAPERLREVARRSAEQTVARRPLGLIIAVLALLMVGNTVVQQGFGRVCSGVEAAVFLVVAWAALLEAHRAQRYLDRIGAR